ncbi:MAG: hypothetical protein EON60_12870 [Alphaproteobacteria bacterium]|nr:MAG: hypothetical protein EON60_12870 [Alphaproteobacteria bacterium]
MKLLKHRLFQRLTSNKGYTIDQTILIVAIIAILITLVIITVGWQLINRTGGTKTAAQLKQVEDANGQFFAQHRVWPHQGYTAPGVSAANNVLALANSTTITTWVAGATTSRKNHLSGFTVTSGNVQHKIGSGGNITMENRATPAAAGIGTDTRLIIQFAGVPLAEAKEADLNIDGAESATQGRVFYRATGTDCYGGGATVAATVSIVNLCYAANTTQ